MESSCECVEKIWVLLISIQGFAVVYYRRISMKFTDKTDFVVMAKPLNDRYL